MMFSDRQTLGHNIQFLDTDQLLGIVPIIQDNSQPPKEILEFDLKELSHRKCRELERYVQKCISRNKQKNEEQKKQKELEEQKLKQQEAVKQQQQQQQYLQNIQVQQ